MTATATTPDFKVADISLAAYGRKEITLAEHEIGLSDLAFALRMRREPPLRQATDAWLDARAERPAGVDSADWLRFEQEKHQRLLAALTPTPETV